MTGTAAHGDVEPVVDTLGAHIERMAELSEAHATGAHDATPSSVCPFCPKVEPDG